MAGGIRIVNNGIGNQLDKMLDRANASGAFARIYPIYQRLQTERFKTENASEGNKWPEYQNPESYKKRKQKEFKSFPGQGNRMLIATSTLAGAVIGPGSPFVSQGISAHRVMFKSSSMEISIITSGKNAKGKAFDYPQYVAEKRPFMKFSQKSLNEMKDELVKFILKG